MSGSQQLNLSATLQICGTITTLITNIFKHCSSFTYTKKRRDSHHICFNGELKQIPCAIRNYLTAIPLFPADVRAKETVSDVFREMLWTQPFMTQHWSACCDFSRIIPTSSPAISLLPLPDNIEYKCLSLISTLWSWWQTVLPSSSLHTSFFFVPTVNPSAAFCCSPARWKDSTSAKIETTFSVFSA